jgi:hypothetical protein
LENILHRNCKGIEVVGVHGCSSSKKKEEEKEEEEEEKEEEAAISEYLD